jgi:hypothetical protein
VTLTAFSDSDWAGSTIDAKSTTGYVLKIARGPVSWTSTKQTLVTTSTGYAEYVAASETTREVAWMRLLLDNINHSQNTTTIFVDADVAINMATTEGHHDRSKHINVKYHYIREAIDERVVTLQKVNTTDNEVDILTKPLDANTHMKLRERIMNINQSQL